MERHKILMDRTAGDWADSAEDSVSSQPYPSTLPGIPKVIFFTCSFILGTRTPSPFLSNQTLNQLLLYLLFGKNVPFLYFLRLF